MNIVPEEDRAKRASHDIARANLASDALNNPLVKEYFIASKAALFERFSKAKPNDDEIKQIHLELQQLGRFESNFEKTILNGEIAKTFLERLANKIKQPLIKR